jgi:hypothetical protein
VLEIIQLFELHRIDLHIDGGWGVDALLGRQTRTHADLDIAVQHKVKFHCGYEFDDDDYRDVKELCQHFAIEMPLEYVEFETIERITPDNVV